MQWSLLLQLLILLVVANGAAVVVKKLLGAAFARPIDGDAVFSDGQPIFGPSKTIRGIVVSLLATSICAAAMGLGWEVGTLVATFAMAGDLFSSFVKRRLHLPSSSMAMGLDHIPESLFPLLASRWLLPLNILDIGGHSIFHSRSMVTINAGTVTVRLLAEVLGAPITPRSSARCLTVIVPAFKSTASHGSPRISLERKPVWIATAMSARHHLAEAEGSGKRSEW